MTSKPKIILLTMGGTIATTTGETPRLNAQRLLESIPDAEKIAEVEGRDVRAKPSSALMLDDIAALLTETEKALKESDGVVITHGTDTMEEMAFALSLLVDTDKPIIITGAMRRPGLPGADGPANLTSALRVATSKTSLGKGVLVVMNDEIHAAAFVQKSHSFLPSAFTSLGPLGYVAEDRVRFLLQPASKLPKLSIGKKYPVVPLLETGLMFENKIIALFAACDGLVLNATGVGHIAAHTVDDLAKIAATQPVLFASRTGHGETFQASYTYGGGEIDLIRRGLIPTGFLNGRQARIALILLLSAGADMNTTKSYFRNLSD